jgi:ABC-type hemin transport system substrate-binding protein
MVGVYTIRYRSTNAVGKPALVVEDPEGIAYLFTAQMFQVRATGAQASERLIHLLGGREAWEEVPGVGPYSLEALRNLLGGGKAMQGCASPC